MKALENAKDPTTKFIYIDLITEWLYDLAKHLKNPIAYIAFVSIVNHVIKLKDLLLSPDVPLKSKTGLVDDVTKYYSEVINALSQEREEKARAILFEAIEKIAIPLFFKIRKYTRLQEES